MKTFSEVPFIFIENFTGSYLAKQLQTDVTACAMRNLLVFERSIFLALPKKEAINLCKLQKLLLFFVCFLWF